MATSRLDQLKAEQARRDKDAARLVELEGELNLRAPAQPDVSGIGAVEAGLIATGKGFTTIGRAVQQAANFLTSDDQEFERLKTQAQQEEQAFQPLAEAQPVATFIGEAVGETAALPIGGVGAGLLRRGGTALISGVAAGAAGESGRGGESVGVAGAIGGALGPVGEAFGALVQRFGGPAVNAITELVRQKTGSVPDGFVTPQGQITKQGEQLLEKIEVTPEEFQSAFGNLTDSSRLQGLPEEAQFRAARAQAEGVSLSEGQATRQFEIQSAEDILKGLEGREGTQARLFFNNQQEALVKSKDSFLAKLGGELDASRTQRGTQVATTIRDINSAEKLAVSDLYKALADIPGGEERIRGDVFRDFSKELAREVVPSGRVRRGVKNILNDFELSKKPKKSDISQGPLTFKNAEAFRQRLNQLPTDKPSDMLYVAQLKQSFDDLVAGATEQLPQNTPIAEAAQAARSAAASRFDAFGAKDIIDDLVSFKKGTKTNKVSDELVLDKILASGNQKVANLKLVRKTLKRNPTPESLQAWANIKTQAMTDVFGSAVTETPESFVISGLKLNSAINKIGDEALDVLLTKTERQALKQLQSVVGDATIPVPRTTNPSGTGQRIINAVGRLVSLPGLTGKLAAFISAGSSAVKDQAQREFILRGIEQGASPLQRTRGFLQMASSLGARGAGIEERERSRDE